MFIFGIYLLNIFVFRIFAEDRVRLGAIEFGEQGFPLVVPALVFVGLICRECVSGGGNRPTDP